MKDLSGVGVDFSPEDHSLDRRWLGVIVVVVFLFYLPFVSRQFVGDDWLWLAYAKKAISSPLIFLERPMYGYFRPLNMVLVFLQRLIFGDNAIFFSLVSILLHCANTWLLWKVLKRLRAPTMMQFAATVFFGFYFLNAPAIEWISVAHDLWVTGLCLLVVLKSLDAVERPDWRTFVQIWAAGTAATLIKESGFVSIGLYVATLVLSGKSPLGRQYRTFTLLAAGFYMLFLIGYAATRTVADREIAVGLDTATNLLYFTVNLLTPFSKRVVEAAPESLLGVMKLVKIMATVVLPAVACLLWYKGSRVCRIFLLWSVAFVLTIAIMKWDVGLFDLYAERTSSRFMYSPVAGVAVCVGWLVAALLERVSLLRSRSVVLLATALFIAGNWLVVRQVSGVYLENQETSRAVIAGCQSSIGALRSSDTVYVVVNDEPDVPPLVLSATHLNAILYVWFNLSVPVRVIRLDEQASDLKRSLQGRALFMRWDSSDRTFHPLEVHI